MKSKDKKSGNELPLEEPSAIIEMDVVEFRRSPSPYLGPDQTDSVHSGGTNESMGSSDPNHLEIQRMEFARNSPVRLTKIYLDEVQESADLDELYSHNEFYVIPKTKGTSANGLIKIANRDGNHIFSCSVRHMKNMMGCRKRQDPKPGKNGEGAVQQRRTKKKCDHSYRILDTQGLELVTGKLTGRVMEVRTALKNSLGVAKRNLLSNKFTVQPAIGPSWICRPSARGCCGLCSCGVKSFQIINSEGGQEIGTMKRDPRTNKFVITMPEDMTIANKGLVLLTGLMIHDQYFSETSCCCNGIFNAKCCCCTVCTIIITILFILLIVFLVLYFTNKDDDSSGATTASAIDSMTERNQQ